MLEAPMFRRGNYALIKSFRLCEPGGLVVRNAYYSGSQQKRRHRPEQLHEAGASEEARRAEAWFGSNTTEAEALTGANTAMAFRPNRIPSDRSNIARPKTSLRWAIRKLAFVEPVVFEP